MDAMSDTGAVLSSLKWMEHHKYLVRVIEWVRCHLQFKECHTYAECCVINTECCDVILSGYYVIKIMD